MDRSTMTSCPHCALRGVVRAGASDPGGPAGSGLTRWIRPRPGISLVELITVMVFVGIVLTIAIPRINIKGIRMDAASRSINMMLLAAQRSAIQKQHNVVVAFDTVNLAIRVHEDRDNDGVMDPGELVRVHPLQEGIRFSRGVATPLAMGGNRVNYAKTQAGLPAVTFSRAGNASEFGGFYIRSFPRGFDPSPDTRGFQIDRATGRTERFTWINATSTWMREF